jgi:rRNA large subunit m3Psi methyltransferase RlmH
MLSTGFAGMVSKAELEASDLVFVSGGADGLPAEWRGHADVLLSLSAMTFPHELARVVLAEQIDRAFTILRGYPHPQWRTNRARGPKKHLAARNPSPGPPQPTLPAVA